MKRLISALVLVAMLLAAAIPALADATPTDRLREGIDAILAVVADPKYENGQNREEMLSQVSTIVRQYFDFAELARRTVPNHWQDFTADQQSQFVEALTQLLEKTYLRKIEGYNNEQVEYVREMIQGNRAMVLTNVTSGDKTFSVNYRLINEGQWMVYDVIGEGISLVKNYRTQFNDLLASGMTPDELIARINEKIAKLDQGLDDEETGQAEQ